MKTVIIKYNAGNIASVMYALERIGVSYLWTDDPHEIQTADKVIFPGVGEASTAMTYLKERGLDQLIPALKQPVLGTCVGLQLMCKHSEENNTTCMGIFDIAVKRFLADTLKVPHVGWNTINFVSHPLLNNVLQESYIYYVHSYYAELSEYTIAETNYTLPFSAMLHRNNFYAAQFHAEISGIIGQTILENFLKL